MLPAKERANEKHMNSENGMEVNILNSLLI
jgi:hypothetical protein